MKANSSRWSSRVGFIFACVGSAVGLGNLWKFPYITYENGGGTFVFIYLFSICLVGLPILICELVLGREAHSNVYQTLKKISNDSFLWKGVGALCLFSAFSILSYYLVVAGWTLNYTYLSLTGAFVGAGAEEINQHFSLFVKNGTLQVFFHSVFAFLTAYIVYKGTKRIEQCMKILMPLLFIFVLILMVISLWNYGYSDTFHFMFNFDSSKITSRSILEAIGHSFFTLSLGMGIMIVYGSYLADNENILTASLWIAALDTLVALGACFTIFPIIFGSKSMQVGESTSILFTAMSYQLHQLPMGQYVSALFYLLVAFAALSSTISLLEPVVSFVEDKFGLSRSRSTFLSIFAVWLLGIGSALSNGASEFFSTIGLMGFLDGLSSKWLLPLGGIMISLFCGYKLSKQRLAQELELSTRSLTFKGFLFCIQLVSPILVFIIFIFGIYLD